MHRKLRSPRRPYRLLVGLRTLMYDQLSRLAGSIACATCYVHVCNTYVRGKWSRLSIRASTILKRLSDSWTKRFNWTIISGERERKKEGKMSKWHRWSIESCNKYKDPEKFRFFLFIYLFNLTNFRRFISLKLPWIVILNSSYLILFPMI